MNENGKAIVHTRDETEILILSKVVLTPTSRVVSSMQFSPRLDHKKTYALDTFHFIKSGKVFLSFDSPF